MKRKPITICALATLGGLTISGPVTAATADDVPMPQSNPLRTLSPVNHEAQVARTCLDRYGLSFAAIACAGGNVTLVEMLKCVDLGIGIPEECLNPHIAAGQTAEQVNQTTDHRVPFNGKGSL